MKIIKRVKLISIQICANWKWKKMLQSIRWIIAQIGSSLMIPSKSLSIDSLIPDSFFGSFFRSILSVTTSKISTTIESSGWHFFCRKMSLREHALDSDDVIITKINKRIQHNFKYIDLSAIIFALTKVTIEDCYSI